LQSQRDDLTRHITDLEENQKTLQTEQITLQQQIALLEQNNQTLQTERDDFARQVSIYTARLSQMTDDLARAWRTRDIFLAITNHELRTPLNIILGFTEALQEEIYGPLTEKQRTTLQTIETSGHNLLTLINNILDLTRIESGNLTLQRTAIDVAELGQAVLRTVRIEAQQKNITLLFSPQEAAGTIQADERYLHRILVSLLSNAVKFTPHNGQVGFDVDWDDAQHVVRLSVWDTGIGIPAEQQAHIFEPFFQLDSGIERRYEGAGLGLALAARLVELHGGSITVESQSGAGSRFTIVLPWNDDN
jgi:signal transduction histidine kinase